MRNRTPKNSWSSLRRFSKDRLPTPSAYYRSQGIKLSGADEWKTALCPFHDDHKPSLRVRVDSGGFKCMACGAKGGDVLAFHMRHKQINFITAAIELGAWEV